MKKFISILLTFAIVIGFVPSIGQQVFATETSNDGAIQVEPAYAKPGGTVTVDVTVKNNPGILGMTLKVTYDESKVTLVSVANGEAFSYMTFTTPKDLSSGCKLPWAAEVITEEDVKDGVIATLTFEVAEETAPNELVEIGLSYENGAIIDNDLEPLSPEIINGVINVIDYTPGDLNEDGFINTTDVVYLMRHIAGGYNVTINESAADVNDDGNRNTTDVVYIMRFIAGGYGVRLKPSTPKCDHSMQAIAAKAATCTEDGNIAYWRCTKCEKCFSDEAGVTEIAFGATVIGAIGHTEVVDVAKAPTCTETGLTEGKHCSVCGEVIVAQTEITANGHTEAIDAAKAPTCTETGLTEGKHCSVCGEVIVAQTEIAAKGHTEVIDAAKAPTCTETGLTEGKHCSVCNAVLLPQTEVPASHSYVDGVCSACGYILPSEGLEFTLNNNGESYSVTGMGTCKDTKVVIPSAHNGKPVTSIDYHAFSGCASLTSITIPDSVTSIGESAFYFCDSLTTIIIPDSVTSIGDHAFAGCIGLTSVTIGNSVTSIGEFVFSDCTSLTSVTIGNSVTSIGEFVFSDCTSLTSITIPDSVTSIDCYAFFGCTSLTSVTIGNGVTRIGEFVFSDCTNLTSVTIGNGVTSICDVAFAYCTSLTSITIPDSVTSIGNDAFAGCIGLTSVTIGNSVTSIGNDAFAGCTSLTSITIPASVTSIGYGAFRSCNNLSIRCEAVSKPEGWTDWNPDNRPVTWDINHTQHVYTAVVTAPTCTEVGYTTYTCACGDTYTADEVAALGHTEAIDAAKAPTCTETGLTEGKHCSVCGKVITEQTEIAANGHNLGIYLTETVNLTHTNSTTYPFVNTNGKWYSTNKGNSTSSTYTVTVPCDCTVTVEYGVSSEINYDKFTIKKNTTTLATISGNTTESKTLELVAGDKITFTYSKDSSVNAGSDSGWFKITATAAPTFSQSVTMQNCTDDVYCNVCNKLVYAKLGHDSVIDAGCAATCTEPGLTEGSHCSRCDKVLVAQTGIPATGHTEIIDVAVAPTGNQTGLTEGKHCSVCEVVTVAQEIIPAIGGNTTEFDGGAGTVESPYLISTAKHLNNVRYYPNAHYKLVSNIAFTSQDYNYSGVFYNSGNYWDPIADFNGTFNGDNHSIDGLKMNRSFSGEKINNAVSTSQYYGLFSNAEGNISNLTLSNVNIRVYVSKYASGNSSFSTSVYVGGVAGRSNGEIANCTVSGTITVTGSTDVVSATVGGVVGYTYSNCSILNSCNRATVKAVCTESTYNYSSGYISSSTAVVGGIVGDFGGKNITDCTNYGSVTANSIISPYAGGIAGDGSSGHMDNKIDVQINNCYNYGVIEATSYPPTSSNTSDNHCAYAGGIVAYMTETNISDCGNFANITAKGWDSYSGGVVGNAYADICTITRCFNKGSVLAYDTHTASGYDSHHAGGISSSGGTIDQCYNTGSVTATGSDYVMAGGITYCTFGRITNCYNSGTISAQEDAYESCVGGIVTACPVAIEYCYNIGELVGKQKGGIACTVYDGTTNYETERHLLDCYFRDNVSVGVYETLDDATKTIYKKSDAELKKQSTFINFDFNNIWMFDGSYSYPQLKNNPSNQT